MLFDDFHAALARDDRGVGEPNEETALQSARDALYPGFEGGGIWDTREETVGGVVAPVRDEGVLRVSRIHPQPGLAAKSVERLQGRLPAEGLDLDGQRALAEDLDRLRAPPLPLMTVRSGPISSAPSIVRLGWASESVASGTPTSLASAAVRSEVGIPRTPRSVPLPRSSPILSTTKAAVVPLPSPTVVPLST